VEHRREQNEILAADQCDFDVVATRQTFVEVRCRVESAESATGNNDFSFITPSWFASDLLMLE
jgi:hypothetical protein